MIVFDMDGVLADTKSLVQRAYRAHSVEMPDDAWSLPWRDWLPPLIGSTIEAAKVHSMKNETYLRLIQAYGVEPLAPAAVAHKMLREKSHSVGVLTGASSRATYAVLGALGLLDMIVLGTSMTPATKFSTLERFGPRETYIDDHEMFPPKGWDFLHYTGQTEEELWTLLS